MKIQFAIRARKLLTLIVVSSIIGLTLISLLPWISVTEVTSSGETVAIYDISIMQQSTNEQIQDIAGNIELTMMVFWVIIIFSVIAFVGIAILASEKHTSLAQLIMMVGCATAVFSIVVVFLQWSSINSIEGMDGISTIKIIGQLPIKYAYLPLAIGGLSLLGSILYTVSFVTFWLQRLTGSIKKHHATTTQVDKPKKKKLFSKREKKTKKLAKGTKEESAMPPSYSGTPIEQEKTPIHDTGAEPEQPQPVELEKPEKPTQPVEPPVNLSTPEEIPIQPELTIEQSLEEKKEPAKKEITVRCPQCKHTFTVEKGEGKTKIQCPKCGKVGIIK
jgi:ribosomal protein S27E